MIFNKEEALNEIMNIFNLGANPKFSEQMKATQKAQDYLQSLYEASFREGFDKGMEATKKVNEL